MISRFRFALPDDASEVASRVGTRIHKTTSWFPSVDHSLASSHRRVPELPFSGVFDGTRFKVVNAMRPRSLRSALWFFPLVVIAGEIRNAVSGAEVLGIVRVTLPVFILALVFTLAALWPAAEAVLRGTGSLVPSVISLVVASLPWIAIKQECVRQRREFEKALTS